MIRAIKCEAGGARHGLIEDEVVLDFETRWRRRIAMTATGGLAFLLDLERPVRLADGDALVLEDGRRVRVRAAAEPLAQITCDDLRHLVRVAWHLGNRHLPTMLDGERLLIRQDHVIEEMAAGLGARVVRVMAPFNPEGGAYGGGGHGHHHHHGDGDESHGHG